MASPPLRSWLPPLALAVVWGLAPALPALGRGDLLGQPFTDLYPSVWGLWWFASQQPGLPIHLDLLGFPEGMGFYFSSPIKGWLAWPLLHLLGTVATWNLLVVAARIGTVMAAWWAGRCWGLGGPGALAAAAVYGCAPFFHGYAVEGIVEGTDGWTLALMAAALGLRRHGWTAVGLALTVLSSWYLGMAGCLLVVLATLRDRRAALGLLGLLPMVPFVLAFTGAFPAMAPLDDEVRRAMGAHLAVPRPGLLEGLQPFAMNTYLGWAMLAAAAWSRSPFVLLASIPALLSLGWGPLYHLPVLQQVRFPYRWHAATLALLAPAVGLSADRLGGWWLAPLIALEGLLLGPTEPLIPGAPAAVPEIYQQVDGPVLVVPGPVALPPGRINPSRPRARYLLYYQTVHGQPQPWRPDFNGVGVPRGGLDLDPMRAFDPVDPSFHSDARLDCAGITRWTDAGVRWVMVERTDLGMVPCRVLGEDLRRCGALLRAEDEKRWLFALPR